MSWPDAQSFCRQNFLDLVSVSSMEDVTLLTQMVDLDAMSTTAQTTNRYRAWIGLSEDLDSWTWSITDPDFYRDREAVFRNWKIEEPDNYQGKESCGVLMYSGEFADLETRCFVCPSGPKMSWSAAQSFCRQHHSDMASVRSSAELQHMKGLVQSSGEKAVWIGLYRNTWLWADGSNVTFSHWRPTEPNGSAENCAAAALGDGGVWEDLGCSTLMPFFCYDVPGSQQVVKVKLVTSSSLDLGDPAVLANLLQQFEEKLKEDSRVEGEVKVRWIDQSDGRIFHQDE
ncbi:C-type mannose receptor 2-like [Poeciliopsis prolifica]|uniref:C-type mannose receptor 2-like n=1 Tax=Poeciliopsis prolifica TaxID=188132 RepID=UPI002413EA45|nr:C-type mannose receptor 2-like [Poeciliopsis prolifica]